MICENGERLAFDIVQEVFNAQVYPQKFTVKSRVSELRPFQLSTEKAQRLPVSLDQLF